MEKENVTIYDVAQKAGKSIATVSRVINKPDLVSKATRDIVYSVMKETGFTPRAEARERARKQVGRIGVIAPNLTYPSFVHRLRGISQALKGESYELVILNLEEDEDMALYLRSPDLHHRIDGFIFLSRKLKGSVLEMLRETHIPSVFVEFGEDGFSSICTDNIKGGEMAARFLKEKGFSSLGILTEKEDALHTHPNEMRVSGFTGFLNSMTAKTTCYIAYGDKDLKSTVKNAEIFLQNHRPEAVFATTDLLAVAVRKASVNLGIKIPEELSLIGFDGTNTSEYLGLTTVDQYLEESGRLSVEILIKRIREPQLPVQSIFLPLKIIERETTT